MKFVRLMAAALAALSVLSLVGCAGGNSAPDNNTTAVTTEAETVEDSKITVNISFVEVNSENGTEKNIFGVDGFEVAGVVGKVHVLDVLKQAMTEFHFEYTLTADRCALHKGLNLENNSEKYWTCVVMRKYGNIEVANLGNAFNAAYISEGDSVIFKYTDRP